TDADAGDRQACSGDASGTYVAFVVNPTTGEWTYTLDNNAANVQALAQGESHDEVFTVTVTDDVGATTTQDVTITVTGSNDGPVISSGSSEGRGEGEESRRARGQGRANRAGAGEHGGDRG